MSLICPVCGNKLRTLKYKLGGGQVDCFTCRTSIRILHHKDGFIISKHVFPPYNETDRYRGPVLTDYAITETKLPTILGMSSPEVRQTTKTGVTA